MRVFNGNDAMHVMLAGKLCEYAYANGNRYTSSMIDDICYAEEVDVVTDDRDDLEKLE